MVTELAIYDFFKNIIAVYKDGYIKGGFFPFPFYGLELNTQNLNQNFYNKLGNILAQEKKYPISFSLPPQTTETSMSRGWQTMKFTVFFVTQAFQDGTAFKNANTALNISDSVAQDDWEGMEIAARSFVNALTYKCNLLDEVNIGLANNINVDKTTIPTVRRYSEMLNDKLNGVSITFAVNIFRGMEYQQISMPDYNLEALKNVPLPDGVIIE